MEKLLVIGDELAKDAELRRFLERDGYEVLQATDRKQGFEMLASNQPTIVIVDQQVEKSDGIEVLKQVRQASKACEVILVTPGGEIEDAIEVLRAGALDYLRRPISMEHLHIALGRADERRTQRQPAEPAVILVIEDHEPTLKRLAHVLEKEGYRVYKAADGEEGMRIYRNRRLDLILADIRMPHKDGLEVLRETKGKGADLEVIVTTGYGDEDVVVQALRGGAINFLRKPIDVEQMLLAIQKALDFQTMRRSLAYRNRDIEIMQELVVRLTRKLELIVETPAGLSAEARSFLSQLVDALPVGIVVVGSDRKIVYANSHVVQLLGHSPLQLSIDWLQKMGLNKVTEEELASAFGRAISSKPGSIETLALSKWAFLVMMPIKMLRPDNSEQFVALAIRGERRVHG